MVFSKQMKTIILRKLTSLMCILFFAHSNLNSQEIITDRPDQTESSSTIPVRSLQIEGGLLMETDRESTQYLLPTVLIRYGVLNIFELRVNQQFMSLRDDVSEKTDFGASDLELGFKVQVLKKEEINTEIAFITHVILPTGARWSTNNRTGFISKICLSHTLNPFLDIGYNVGYFNPGTTQGDLLYTIALGSGLSKRFGMYIEMFGELVEFEEFMMNADGGFTFLLKENLQLDLSGGTGLNHRMSYIAAGISWNFGLFR